MCICKSAGYLNDLWKYDGTYWTWLSGSNNTQDLGSYGLLGVPDSKNNPASRQLPGYCVDSQDNFWIFGGEWSFSRNTSDIVPSLLYNDLWRYDGTYWTWISGFNIEAQYGKYLSKGWKSPVNFPGGRRSSAVWIDSGNNLWIFGGYGYSETDFGFLSDLWQFDGAFWTWVSGPNLANVETPNSPLPRERAISLSHVSSDTFWLLGGLAWASKNVSRNDIWKFSALNVDEPLPSRNFTGNYFIEDEICLPEPGPLSAYFVWVSGTNGTEIVGVYGDLGVASINNRPPPRAGATSQIDSMGNLWLFGGYKEYYGHGNK